MVTAALEKQSVGSPSNRSEASGTPRTWGLWLAVVVAIGVALMPAQTGLPVAGQYTLALLAFAVILWITEAVDYAVSAVMLAALMALVLGLAPDVAKPAQSIGTGAALGMALSGFANSATALVAAATFLAAAMTITGLDRRIALFILAKVGAKTRHVVIGAMLVGIVLAFIVPSTTARVACLVPIMMGIILAFQVDPHSRFAGLLMITTAQTASVWNVGIKTAAAQNMVAVGFIEKTLNHTISWGEWFVAAAPFSLLMTIALYFIMTRMMPAETEEIAGGKDAVRKALSALGPISWAEIRLLAMTLILLAFWASEKVLHAFDTATTTITAIALMFLPGIGVMSWKAAQSKVPWGTLMLFGVGISLGTVLLQTKAAAWLANLIVTGGGLAGASLFLVLALLSLFLIVVHLGFASATALASAMIPIMISVLQQLQVPAHQIVGAAMILQFVVSFGFILPVNAPQNMVAYGTDTFTARDFVRTGLVITVVGYALVLVFALTYWRWLGHL
jgi:solute carrier family 13 (sodium-dependent dicarboxylate transporter), member 2/3/5